VVCTALAEAFEWTPLRRGSTALLVVLILLRWFMKDHLSDAVRKRRLNVLFKRYPPPLVEEADLYAMFGVTPSPLADTDSPYVARDIDDQLDRALRNERLVLVIVSGPSKAGKSRTAAEGVRRVYPRCKLLVPQTQGHVTGYCR
jgi:hypothetical protein